MSHDNKILTLIDADIDIRRQHCKALARLYAIEAVLLESAPEADRMRLHERINVLAAEFHQRILEQYENHSPSVAAILDDRKPDQMP